jgi:hypothetical protein
VGSSADQSTSPGSLTSSRHHIMLAMSQATARSSRFVREDEVRSRDDLVRQRHEPRPLLKHHTEIGKRKPRQQKRRTEWISKPLANPHTY